jgi:hypothetical protein
LTLAGRATVALIWAVIAASAVMLYLLFCPFLIFKRRD